MLSLVFAVTNEMIALHAQITTCLFDSEISNLCPFISGVAQSLMRAIPIYIFL